MQFRASAVTFFALLGLVLASSASSYGQGNKVAPVAQKLVATPTTSPRKPVASPTTNTITVKPVVAAAPQPAKPFSISVSASRSRSLYDYQDGTLSETNDFQFIPSYAWSKGKTTLYMTYSQDLRAEDDANDIGDIAVINSLKAWDLPKIKLAPSMTVMIPQSKASREVKNLEGALSVKLAASIKEELLIPGLSLSASISAGRSFHRYNTDTTGAINNQHSSRQTLVAGYAVGVFSFDTEFHHVNGWNYNGTLKESFEHAEEVSISIGDHFGFTLGHTNAGSVFQANGYESNYKLIDDNNSLAYAKVSMQY